MQHIAVNFKRFDVPAVQGGVNRLGKIEDFSKIIIERTLAELEQYDCTAVGFSQYYPEAQLPTAVKAVGSSKALAIGCQGVYRADIAPGGNFGAFTTNRPAAAAVALGCSTTIIGHCEERNDKNELLALGGNKDRKLVNTIFNKEIICAQKQGMDVLYCIGEKAEETDDWQAVLTEQIQVGLDGCNLSKIIIAYEPVWSIGPGKVPADKPYITKVAKLIKKVAGKDMPVIYGGGLKKDNAAMLASIDEIDGGLIALTRFSGDFGFYPDEYLEIVRLYLEGKGIKART
ncbi:MAG: triose-phosphate isomerase [Spirochaetia bacterium]|jgi:triosephosphate isomerase|nr:triose-phosphate isomerase [Spirochaetia bacterium]